MHYEFTLTNSDHSRTRVTVDPAEYQDQLSYCQQGTSAGWLLSYSIEIIGEEY